VTDAADALLADGLQVEVVPEGRSDGSRHIDAVLKIRTGRKVLKFRAETKRTVSRATIGTFLLQHRTLSDDLVLVTEYVSPPLADELRRRHVQFIDTAGNAFLDRDGLFVFVSGRKPRQPSFVPRPTRAFRESGLKLVFALLAQPDLVKETFRKISAKTDVAVGTVHWVMKDLRDLGFVADLPDGRRLIDRMRLLTAWTEAYHRILRPKIVIGRFTATTRDWWSSDIREYGAVWGGEVAAARLTHILKPGIATIYVETSPHMLIVKFRLRPEPEGTVEIRKRFWRFHDQWEERGIAPPLLTYADLLGVGDWRSVQAARAIHDKYLT
jgi:hypothetical protein